MEKGRLSRPAVRANLAVLEQHAEEAAFLWMLRDAAAGAPHYTLDHLARLDERVEAHVDGLRVAGEAAWEICKKGLEREEAGEVFAASIVALEANRRDYQESVRQAARSPKLLRGWEGALHWLGRGGSPVVKPEECGDPAAIPDLLARMSDPPRARRAGESFEMITGFDVGGGTKPNGFEPGPTERAEDEGVELDPDEHLPWPDAEKVRSWWEEHRSEFNVGTRYLLGKPMEIPWLIEVLRHGRQRQRAVAAAELAIRQPDRPLFDVRAPAFRQRALLTRLGL